jgi:hypothetical protein
MDRWAEPSIITRILNFRLRRQRDSRSGTIPMIGALSAIAGID